MNTNKVTLIGTRIGKNGLDDNGSSSSSSTNNNSIRMGSASKSNSNQAMVSKELKSRNQGPILNLILMRMIHIQYWAFVAGRLRQKFQQHSVERC